MSQGRATTGTRSSKNASIPLPAASGVGEMPRCRARGRGTAGRSLGVGARGPQRRGAVTDLRRVQHQPMAAGQTAGARGDDVRRLSPQRRQPHAADCGKDAVAATTRSSSRGSVPAAAAFERRQRIARPEDRVRDPPGRRGAGESRRSEVQPVRMLYASELRGVPSHAQNEAMPLCLSRRGPLLRGAGWAVEPNSTGDERWCGAPAGEDGLGDPVQFG
jgi:hypothetical protein